MEHSRTGKDRKVVVVGAGAVGATFCYALAQSGVADTIVLVDQNRDLAEGQALDLSHGQPFFPEVSIRAGDARDYGDADVIVMTAGARQREGETRLDLLKRNVGIVESVTGDIVARNSHAVMVVVSNPVDVLTWAALRTSGWSRGRVIGSGTVLDSARLRYLIAQHCGIDVHNVHAYVFGEHGDSEFAAWSRTHMAGLPLQDYCAGCGRCEGWKTMADSIESRVRDSAYHIISYKGATNFGVGMALVRIIGAILRSERSVLTVSTRLDGEYGLRDVCLSVPAIVSGNGVENVIDGSLARGERESLKKSAEVIRGSIEAISKQE